MKPVFQSFQNNSIQGNYFRKEVWQYDHMGDYTDPDLKIPVNSYEWNWTMGEIITAFGDAGMMIVFLHEFPQYFYNGYTLFGLWIMMASPVDTGQARHLENRVFEPLSALDDDRLARSGRQLGTFGPSRRITPAFGRLSGCPDRPNNSGEAALDGGWGSATRFWLG